MSNEMINEIENGVILKSASVEMQEISTEDLKKINKFTLSPLKADEVFAFKTIIGDNETDDRNCEPFNLTALKDMKNLYIGRTVIKDHFRKADNQVARIYDTELISEAKSTRAGEPFSKVVAKCYMVITDSNKDLIAEIKAGIKKEVSTGVRPKKLICNICGKDNMKTYCPHYPGRDYDKENGKTVCMLTIDGVKEAYELSFVAVPAQPRAGTVKNYCPKPAEKQETAETKNQIDTEKESEAIVRLRAVDSFIFSKNKEE